MSNLAILGAGGFARETWWHLHETDPEVSPVFVDDVTETTEIRMGEVRVPVVKDWQFASAGADGRAVEEFVVAIAAPAGKRAMVKKALEAGLRPAPTIVHPAARIQGSDCRIGVGGIIAPGVIATTNVTIGDYVILNLNSTIGHDATIGDFATINPGVQISGNVTIEEDVLLGTGVAIREGIRIARGVVVGAQSAVVKDLLEPDIVVAGVPARLLSRR